MESVTDIIKDVKLDICSHYCKWPEKWDEEKDGGEPELSETGICGQCTLGRL